MLKWKSIDKNKSKSLQRAFFNHIESGKIIETSNYTKNLGILIGIVYFSMYIYIYVTSYIYMKKNKLPMNWITTTSESYQYCGKKLTIVFLITFLALLQLLFNRQNFYNKDKKSISVVIVNYIIITCWLLFFYVVPSQNNNGSIRNGHVFHFILAIIVLLSVIYNSTSILELYDRYYDKDSLKNVSNVSNTITGCFSILSFIILVHVVVSVYAKKYSYVTSSLIGLMEGLCLFLFGIFVVYFSMLPPLMDEMDLQCVIYR